MTTDVSAVFYTILHVFCDVTVILGFDQRLLHTSEGYLPSRVNVLALLALHQRAVPPVGGCLFMDRMFGVVAMLQRG